MKRTGECCENLGRLLAASVFFVQHLPIYRAKGRLGEKSDMHTSCHSLKKSREYLINDKGQ